MISLTPEDSEKALEEFILKANDHNASSDIANESLTLLNDNGCKKIFLASLLIKHKDRFKDLDNGRYEMREALKFFLQGAKVCPKIHNAKKHRLEFAIDQFVEAFYCFDEIEYKYPNLVKELK